MIDQLPDKVKRHTCQCCKKSCGHRWTQDIIYTHTGWNYDRWGNKSTPVYKNQPFKNGLKNGATLPPCPACGYPVIKSDVIRGKYSADHKCNRKCTSALGADCECQCAGENHGADHLLKI